MSLTDQRVFYLMKVSYLGFRMRLFPASGKLSFIRRHCLPQDLEVLLEAAISRIPMQGAGEPAVGGRQVAGGAMSGKVHRAKHGLGFWV